MIKGDAQRRREELLGSAPLLPIFMPSLGTANPARKIPWSVVAAKQRELCEKRALEKEGWELSIHSLQR